MSVEFQVEQEQITKVPFSEVLQEVHPHLYGTPIPELITQLLLWMKTISHNFKGAYVGGGDAHVRGSLIKRKELGTPVGYVELCHLFKEYLQRNGPPRNELHARIFEKLSHGPNEVDVRYIFLDESKVIPHIRKYLLNDGFIQENPLLFKNSNHEIKLKPFFVGSHTYKFQIVHVCITDITTGKEILVLELSNEPDQRKYRNDLRLSWTAGLFELFSVRGLMLKDNEAHLLLDDKFSLKKYLGGQMGQLSAHINMQLYYSNAFVNMLRESSSFILWRDCYDGNAAEYLFDGLRTDLAEIGMGESKNFKTMLDYPLNEVPTLEDIYRIFCWRETALSDLILYMTYDPVATLFVLYETKLIEYLPLNKIIDSPQKYARVMAELKAKVGTDYKQHVVVNQSSRLEQSGLFLLGEVLGIDSLEDIISLLDPVKTITLDTAYKSIGASLRAVKSDMREFVFWKLHHKKSKQKSK